MHPLTPYTDVDLQCIKNDRYSGHHWKYPRNEFHVPHSHTISDILVKRERQFSGFFVYVRKNFEKDAMPLISIFMPFPFLLSGLFMHFTCVSSTCLLLLLLYVISQHILTRSLLYDSMTTKKMLINNARWCLLKSCFVSKNFDIRKCVEKGEKSYHKAKRKLPEASKAHKVNFWVFSMERI